MKKADKIKFDLMRSVRSHAWDVLIPNFFVDGYEMDLFVLTKSGVLTEYELKISRSDFFNDFKKGSKHSRMASKECKANKFIYVVPSGLICVDEIPAYAGLWYYDKGYFQVVKNAPIIHRNKYAGSELVHKLAFRCDNLSGKLRYLKYQEEDLKKRVKSLKETLRQLDPKNIQLFI